MIILWKAMAVTKPWFAVILVCSVIQTTLSTSGHLVPKSLPSMATSLESKGNVSRPVPRPNKAHDNLCLSDGCIHEASSLLKNMDLEASPCDDFYQFTCGKFRVKPIPDDKSSLSVFSDISDELQQQLRSIMEEPVLPSEPKPFTYAKVLYKICMNKSRIEMQGEERARVQLKELGGWPVLDGESWDEGAWHWRDAVYKFRQAGLSVDYIIDFSVTVDYKNTTHRIIDLDQASLALNREFFMKGLENRLVSAYAKYMVDMAVLMGADKKRAETELSESLAFEMKLANISLPMEKKRNATLLYNKMTIQELQAKFPSIPWREYISKILPTKITISEEEPIIVEVPTYLTELEKILEQTPKRVVANYMMWRAAASMVSYMPEKFRARQLEYYTAVTGTSEREARWKECADHAASSLSLAVGSLYIRKYFDEAAKKNALDLVKRIRAEMYKILENVEWMDEDTKSKEVYDVQYTKYLGDGDSKAFIAVSEALPYGPEKKIEKIECVGHIQKRMGTRLRNLKKKIGNKKLSDGKALGGKGRLTESAIDKIQTYYGLAIRRNCMESLHKMRKEVWATYLHLYSTDEFPNHDFCPTGNDSWCKYQKVREDLNISYRHSEHFHLPSAVMTEIKPIFASLSHPDLLSKCLHGKTQNCNESFNNLLWTIIPKRVFVSIQTLKLGAYEAVLIFNRGNISRKNALEKAKTMTEHIAYPDELLNHEKLEQFYENYEISDGDFLDAVLNTTKFAFEFNFGRLRDPVNKTEWFSHGRPTVVNAYYNSIENSIQFPAGILQGTFFSNKRPSYMNYGAIGYVIGHEITHGFDDQGRQFDAAGNLVDWWAAETKEKYLEKARCIIEQYGNYTDSQVNMSLNGINTQGENIADNGGIKEAYKAYVSWAEENGEEPRLPGLQDYNPRQMFWISAGSVWCSVYRNETLSNRITTGYHSPGEFRVRGPLSNRPEFAEDFNCPLGSPMNPVKKCHVW